MVYKIGHNVKAITIAINLCILNIQPIIYIFDVSPFFIF